MLHLITAICLFCTATLPYVHTHQTSTHHNPLDGLHAEHGHHLDHHYDGQHHHSHDHHPKNGITVLVAQQEGEQHHVHLPGLRYIPVINSLDTLHLGLLLVSLNDQGKGLCQPRRQKNTSCYRPLPCSPQRKHIFHFTNLPPPLV